MSSSQQPPADGEWYAVYKPEFDTAAHDPLDPVKRYHEGVFVETDPIAKSGTIFHVTGDIIAGSGMRYEERPRIPSSSIHLHTLPRIGWVRKEDFDSGRISTVLRALPRPTKQQGINFWQVDPTTGRHEITWTREDGELYGPGEPRRPIFKCNEWTRDHAIPALRAHGILQFSD